MNETGSANCHADDYGEPFRYRVGFLGLPNSVDRLGPLLHATPWTRENLLRLKDLGFNTIQVNVAWGPRPADEPLNLEDVVELTEQEASLYPQVVPLRCDPSPERRIQRQADVKARSALCKELGLRTIFHFGAPYNAHGAYGDTPPNCLLDEKVLKRYELLVAHFAAIFPDVDDILLYTYDQDAWLCGEFGQCPRCAGKPLHARLIPFLNRMAAAWRVYRPEGKLWWEPWELSAGQVYACLIEVTPEGFGVSLHANVAEVMATLPVDRWLKNTCALAAKRGIPAIVEYFLGAGSEELEPLINLAHPLVTLRALRAIAGVFGVVGIKEYYGLAPDREDPNLRMVELFLTDSSLSDEAALADLAESYGAAAAGIAEFWRLASTGMEFYPWEATWFTRRIGSARVDHALSAAVIRSLSSITPAWASTRKGTFIACVTPDDHPWLLEDIQLRCEAAARAWLTAERTGWNLVADVPTAIREPFKQNLLDLGRLKRRAMAYAYHLRETNLTTVIRLGVAGERLWTELQALLLTDRANFEEECAVSATLPTGEPVGTWPEMDEAIDLVEKDRKAFLKTYFLGGPDRQSKGMFSMTSL